jgi:hypothetical protein
METITAKGLTGEVSFDGQFITITRNGWLARARADTAMGRLFGDKGEKRIPVQSITAVQWKPANIMSNGFIQFTLAGGIERTGRFRKARKEAVTDENSVVFLVGRQAAAFEQVRNAVEQAIAARGAVA